MRERGEEEQWVWEEEEEEEPMRDRGVGLKSLFLSWSWIFGQNEWGLPFQNPIGTNWFASDRWCYIKL